MSSSALSQEHYLPSTVEFSSHEESAEFAAHLIAEIIQKNPKATLGLPTGRTAIELYKNLVSVVNTKKIDVQKITTFNLDEYVGIDVKSEDSFHSFMNKNLFDPLDINPSQSFFPEPNNPQNYDRQIEKRGGLDLCVLGLGLNGHIAFNEPGSKINSPTRIVELSRETRTANRDQFQHLSSPPTHAITMGLHTILSSNRIFLLCNTKQKWSNLLPYIQARHINPLFPASYLLGHPNVQIFHV